LIQTLLEQDLIDEFRLWIFPVAIGTGKRLFGDGTIPVAFKLVDSFVTKTGVTVNTYARAGEIEIGEMDFDEPTEAELERRKRLAEVPGHLGQLSRNVRSSPWRREGSARMSIATILPALTVKPLTENSSPSRLATKPTAPLISASSIARPSRE
jgi:RibD C-terminal domain